MTSYMIPVHSALHRAAFFLIKRNGHKFQRSYFHQLLNVIFRENYDTNFAPPPDKIKLCFIWFMTILGSLRQLTGNLIKQHRGPTFFVTTLFLSTRFKEMSRASSKANKTRSIKLVTSWRRFLSIYFHLNSLFIE